MKELPFKKHYLKPGLIYVTQTPVVITTVLESCVSVCLYGTEMRFGGMNHYLLPYPGHSDEPTARLGTVAMYELYYSFIYIQRRKILSPASLEGQILKTAGIPEGTLMKTYISAGNAFINSVFQPFPKIQGVLPAKNYITLPETMN